MALFQTSVFSTDESLTCKVLYKFSPFFKLGSGLHHFITVDLSSKKSRDIVTLIIDFQYSLT